MCSINGYVDYSGGRTSPEGQVRTAGETMRRRGPDGHGIHVSEGVAFYHNRLAVMDPEGGKQPMSVSVGERRYTVVYNGELYNSAELRRELSAKGAVFKTSCDTETVLWSYIVWGQECPARFNGIFAFAVCEEGADKVFFARDRLGVKPFFYAVRGSRFFFASEIKALLSHPEIPPEVDKVELW